ncbi:hypothetical protein DRO61_00310 [Candidatus Bathyarchaeota archaeon]|nr:MAG: hypothetical protein DRO61_00310 [Candidatus Bathyarchaeota archaeon]
MSELKILKAEINNFKNLSHTTFHMNGKSTLIVGANQQGKSSFLQAVFSPFLKTYKPTQPIKEGEERGSVSVVIGGDLNGEQVEYNVDMYFSQEKQAGRLVITDKDGAKVKSPASALEQITGDISFDVDRFLQLAKTPSGTQSKEGVKKQIEMLKAFIPKEAQKEMMAIDIRRKEIVEKRTENNSQIKFLEEQNNHEFTDVDLEKYGELKSSEEVDKKLNDLGEAIEKWQKANSKTSEIEREIVEMENLAKQLDGEKEKWNVVKNFIDSMEPYKKEQKTANMLVNVAKFKNELGESIGLMSEAKESLPKKQEDLDKFKAWLEKNKKPSTESLLEQKAAIDEWNKKASEVVKIKERHVEIQKKKNLSVKMTEEINKCVKDKKQVFIDNPLPVKGLEFTEDKVLYKGLEFNENQHPTSVIIGVGVKIAMAMNPNLKIIIIRDGSLLDKKLYNGILTMVEKNGYQLFIEMVDWNAGDMDIKFAETVD